MLLIIICAYEYREGQWAWKLTSGGRGTCVRACVHLYENVVVRAFRCTHLLASRALLLRWQRTYSASREADFFPPCCNSRETPPTIMRASAMWRKQPRLSRRRRRQFCARSVYARFSHCFSLYIRTSTPRSHRCQDSIPWFAAYCRTALM